MNEKELYTVVVTDDEPELLEAVCTMIRWEEIGFRLVGSAGNGLDALQLVEQLQPDLLLSDIHMPFISGVELARQVRELRPMTHIAFLSGYDDFEYAQKAIEYNVISYLLKPIGMADLTEALREIHKKIRRHYQSLLAPRSGQQGWEPFLAPLLLDDFTDEQELSEEALAAAGKAAGLFPDVPEPTFVVLASRMGQEAATVEMAGAADLILAQYYPAKSLCAGRQVLTLLASAGDFAWLSIALDELGQAVGRVWGCACTTGVSRPFHHWAKCHSAAREAVDALRFAAPGADGLRRLPEAEAGSGRKTDYSALTDQLESLLRSGSRMELEQYLHELRGSREDVTLLQILATALRVLGAAASDEQVQELRRRCHLEESPFSAVPEEERWKRAAQLCLAARELLSSQRQGGVSLLCDKALEDINRNYMDEQLSLSTVSERLHVSPNYLSANMKKYAGDTFINLLIKKRMEVAWELLKTTNWKILEVAKRCGYSDQHYFSYCFKKYYGVSPVALRRSGGGT